MCITFEWRLCEAEFTCVLNQCLRNCRYTTTDWTTVHEAALVYKTSADDGARDLFEFSHRLPATLAGEMRLKFAIRYVCNGQV